MVTYIFMAGVLLFLATVLLWKISYQEDREDFFNKKDTLALRGFWSLIVILVHVPACYVNPVQDALGSFGYIGVTFFFLISGYGLQYGKMRRPEMLDGFWRRRLPKLLIPVVTVYLFMGVLRFLLYGEVFSRSIVATLGRWVPLLIACYLIFWIVHWICNKSPKWKNKPEWIVVTMVALYSLAVQLSVYNGGWPVESLGFGYGVLLAKYYTPFKKHMENHWLTKTMLLLGLSLVLGIAYLKFKYIPFWGAYILKILLGLALVLLVLQLLLRFQILNSANQFLGKISYVIYLIHPEILGAFERKLPQLNSGIAIVCALVAIIIASWLITKMNERICHFIECIL